MQIILAESHPVVLEMARPGIIFVPAEDPILPRDAHYPLNDLKGFNLLTIYRGGITDQIDLRQGLLYPNLFMGTATDVRQAPQLVEELQVLGIVFIRIRMKDDDHGLPFN